jgi:thiol-disulfide isomerase/thioredoxin
MDRLSALSLAVALVGLVACDESKSTQPPPSRVNAAKTAKTQGTTVESFCDVRPAADTAPQLAWPRLAEPAPAPATTWRWINVWATWCKPCVEEIPLLARWRDKLKGTRPFDLTFVSIDESADDLAAYKKAHPDTPPTLRIADTKVQEAWFVQLGLTAGTPIPVHIFVDARQRVRCVRAGAVREQDFAIVEKLLGE